MAGGGLGFGAGIAKGLSNAFLREHAEKEATRARDFSTLFPVYLDNAINSGDYSGLENFVAQFGGPDLAKTLRKNQPFAALAPLLAGQRREGAMNKVLSPPTLGAPQQGGGQTGMFGLQQPQAEPAPPSGLATPNAEPGPPGSPQPLTAGPQLVSPTVQAPLPVQQSSQSTFFGSPMLTPTQRAERQAQAAVVFDRAQYNERLARAKQAWPNDPDRQQEYALYNTRPPGSAASGGSTSPSALFADQLKRRAAELKRPLTSAEVAEERKQWEALNDRPVSMGTWTEQAAHDLGFDSAVAAADAGRMADVNKRADELAASRSGATTSARVGEQAKAPMTTKQKFDALMALQDDWRKAEAPQREMERQFQLMQTGLNRYEADPIGGSQAVLVTFQKILDPTSVVRETEYARSPQGLAILDRLQGLYDKYSVGGAGVPKEVLAGMVETARQFLAGQADWNALERERITKTATDAGLNPERIFGAGAVGAGTGGGSAAGGGAAAPAHEPGKPYLENGKWVIP